MVLKASLFSQAAHLIPRQKRSKIVELGGYDKHFKKFKTWGRLVAMLFCHLGQAKSLREISLGLGSVHGKIRHLGTKRALNKSTLAHANLKRNPKVFEEVFYCLYESILSKTQHGPYKPKKIGRKFRFKNKLLSLDASIITHCTKTFDWAHYNRSKGGIKLHLILDHDGHLPRFATLTTANVADISAAKSMDFPSHCVLTFDRVFWDYK